jgi:hypothetical protein
MKEPLELQNFVLINTIYSITLRVDPPLLLTKDWFTKRRTRFVTMT